MDEGYQVRLTEFLIYVCIYVSISVLLRNYIITINIMSYFGIAYYIYYLM